MTPNETRAKKYVADINAALKAHGMYAYFDKGPIEVMELPTSELQALPVDDVAETLKIVVEKAKETGEKFVSHVLLRLQDWPEFDALLDKHKWLADYY